MSGDWILTARQTVPRLGRVIRALRPTLRVAGADRIDAQFLRTHGIEGVIWDVDGTLMPYHAAFMPDPVARAFTRLLESSGTRHILASNCDERRFDELAAIFPHVPLLKVYDSPGGVAALYRHGPDESWLPTRPTGPLRPIRKPDERIARLALDAIGVPAERAAVVGDQHFTDIAMANLAGIRSIKVPTLAPESFPAVLRLLQRLEAGLARVTS